MATLRLETEWGAIFNNARGKNFPLEEYGDNT